MRILDALRFLYRDTRSEFWGRLAVYKDDWLDGWRCGYRILAPSVYIMFASALPALAFGQQLAEYTNGTLTVVHVLTSTAMTGLLQSVLGGQPLLIVGVAEPIVLIYKFLYEACCGAQRTTLPGSGSADIAHAACGARLVQRCLAAVRCRQLVMIPMAARLDVFQRLASNLQHSPRNPLAPASLPQARFFEDRTEGRGPMQPLSPSPVAPFPPSPSCTRPEPGLNPVARVPTRRGFSKTIPRRSAPYPMSPVPCPLSPLPAFPPPKP
mmetsp:Transcript_5953/g.18333  ORF Transcript_5953/g.18333 Transcript_5953/m.18333 type:complete len:267 (+) Transcript_5953:516-1316(+)